MNEIYPSNASETCLESTRTKREQKKKHISTTQHNWKWKIEVKAALNKRLPMNDYTNPPSKLNYYPTLEKCRLNFDKQIETEPRYFKYVPSNSKLLSFAVFFPQKRVASAIECLYAEWKQRHWNVAYVFFVFVVLPRGKNIEAILICGSICFVYTCTWFDRCHE